MCVFTVVLVDSSGVPGFYNTNYFSGSLDADNKHHVCGIQVGFENNGKSTKISIQNQMTRISPEQKRPSFLHFMGFCLITPEIQENVLFALHVFFRLQLGSIKK